MVSKNHHKMGARAYARHTHRMHTVRSYYRFQVGTCIRHETHGTGKVLELMVDGRTRVLFDSGSEHRYTPASVAGLTLALNPTLILTITRYKPASMAKLTLGNPKANLKAGLQRFSTLNKAAVALSEVTLRVSEGDSSGGDSNSTPRSASPKRSRNPLKGEQTLRLSPMKAGRKLMVETPADIEQGGGFKGSNVSAGSLKLTRQSSGSLKLGRKLLAERISQKADALAEKEAAAGSRFGAGMKLVIVHAINDAVDGCEFEHFFSTTPPDLVQAATLLLTTHYLLTVLYFTNLLTTDLVQAAILLLTTHRLLTD